MMIEPTSHLWHKRLLDNNIPKNGTLVEVAPGYEPKIGQALYLYGFKGTIFIIEPDERAARHIQKEYQKILPQVIVKVIPKLLEDIVVGIDVPGGVDALVASHPFDDMVMAQIVNQTSFFSQEKDEASLSSIYTAATDKDYKYGISAVVRIWQQVIKKLKPAYFIASQYPSRTLDVRGLWQRQRSGFVVLHELKNFYKNRLREQPHEPSFDYKGDPKWWIVVKSTPPFLPLKGRLGGVIADDLCGQPLAITRLDKSIFVPQAAQRLHPNKYDVIYVDRRYFKNQGYNNISKYIKNFAIALDNKQNILDPKIADRQFLGQMKNKNHLHTKSDRTWCAFADRQKDTTDISLSGNLGSGRAVYYGSNFNVLGVGKTTLCQSAKPSHSTGKLELIGAMRRLILSKWINRLTRVTLAGKDDPGVIHPLLLALKETAHYRWNPHPVPLAILVRVDDGSLDRPSHIEYCPQIPIDFQKILAAYAKLDAEYFAFRIMLGAWSTGNYSLSGQMIDLETATFTKYRGPYYTACSKYPENRFGYEGFGFIKILEQLAHIKNIDDRNIRPEFYRERSTHLGYCFLSLLGIRNEKATAFFKKNQNVVVNLSHQFEKLAKKISPQKTNLNLYFPVSDNNDPTLLDMSNLFRNLAKLYDSSSDWEEKAFNCLVRKTALAQVRFRLPKEQPQSLAETFIQKHAVITNDELNNFLHEIKNFIRNIFKLISILRTEGCLGEKLIWHDRLQKINQDLPPIFELNTQLFEWAEQYRLGKIDAKNLGKKITTFSKLP